MPAGEPVLSSSSGNGQLVGNDLRTATRARDIPAQSAHPQTAARGDRRYGVALRAPPPRRPPQPQPKPAWV